MSAIDTALSGLQDLIASGDLGPGDRLPTEVELARRLGVSRGSLREAMQMLRVMGVIVSRQGSGSYLCDLAPDDIFTSLAVTIRLVPLDGFLEILQLRQVVESQVSALAAARIDDDGLAGLRELAEAARQANLNDSTPFDHAFHDRLAEVAGNRAFRALLSVLRQRSVEYRLYDLPGGCAAKERSDEGHFEILAGLQARDPVRAGAAASAHVQATIMQLQAVRPDPTLTHDGELGR